MSLHTADAPPGRVLADPATARPTGRPGERRGAWFSQRFDGSRGGRHEIDVPLEALGDSEAVESWLGGPATRIDRGPGTLAVEAPAGLCLAWTLPLSAGEDIAPLAQQAYRALLGELRARGYPHLVRTWNVIPDLNAGTGDEERYVRFNVGRAAAFDELAWQEPSYAAATCVGSDPGTAFVLIALASRHEPVMIENPRQVSAYRYPRQYGPRAPSFARATLLGDASGATLLVSGTASIVGHESRHDDVRNQLGETLANVHRLRDEALARLPGWRPADGGAWRVYLRHPADLAVVRPEVERELGGRESVIYLRADICRRELTVEIEGVCSFTPDPVAPP